MLSCSWFIVHWRKEEGFDALHARFIPMFWQVGVDKQCSDHASGVMV